MAPEDYSVLAAAVLQRKATTPPRLSETSRERCIAVIAQAMEHSSRKRRRARQWLGAFCAAAAVVAIALPIAYRHGRDQSARTAHVCSQVQGNCANGLGSVTATLDVGHMGQHQVVPGALLKSARGESAQVQFDSGTQLELGAESTVAYEEGSALHRFSMSRGSVRFRVAKLGKGERFLLNTLDAEIEVRGTVFGVRVVDPSNGCGRHTAVSVDEGVVEVRTAEGVHTLHAGEHWPVNCPASNEAHRQDSPHRKLRAKPQELAPTPRPETDDSSTVTPTAGQRDDRTQPEAERTEQQSALAAQNDLYARGCREAKAGHAAQALTLFEQLINRYPSSALVESAYAQRLRVLGSTHNGQARAEAQRYLERFPHGFARAEARQLLDLP
jgi:ferric-dicitrate binding protein FerR (iron transport regulator)